MPAVRRTRARGSAVREPHEGQGASAIRSVRAVPAGIADAFSGVAREMRHIVLAPFRAIGRKVPGVPVPTRRGRGGSTVARPPRRATGPRPLTEADRRELARRRQLRGRRIRAVALAALLALLAVGWLVIPGANLFRITHVEVLGATATGDLEARGRVDSLLRGETIFTVDAEAVEHRLEELPFVRDAHVETHLVGGLGLRIDEYQPLAVGLADGATWLVARDGRVLARARKGDWTGRVPLVVLRGTNLEPGDRLEGEPGLQVLAGMPGDATFSFSSIELREGRVLVGHLRGQEMEIRFGRPHGADDLRTKLASARAAIGEARRMKLGTLAYVDVSVPSRPATCPQAQRSCAAPPRIEVAEKAKVGGAGTRDAGAELTDAP